MKSLKLLSIKLKNLRLKLLQGKTDEEVKLDIIKMMLMDYNKGIITGEEYRLMMIELDKIYGK